ncbi:hypothetical protein L7F22_047676 [Adiantum nelumboides]|nr:hypothetical protein [Adiantum nelumboides]
MNRARLARHRTFNHGQGPCSIGCQWASVLPKAGLRTVQQQQVRQRVVDAPNRAEEAAGPQSEGQGSGGHGLLVWPATIKAAAPIVESSGSAVEQRNSAACVSC